MSKMRTGIAVVFLVCVVMTLCFFSYQKGFGEGKEIGILESRLQAKAQAQEYIFQPESPDITEELAKSLIEGLKSANVTFEYDQSGYSKGVITLYWER